MIKIRILLADDHQFITEGLKGLLEPKYDVVGAISDGQTLVKEAARLKPDIIVLDISMPKLNGLDAAEQIMKSDKKVKIIFLTMHDDVHLATKAMEMGASGFILKHSASDELHTAIEKAMVGRTFVTEKIASKMEINRLLRKNPVHEITARKKEVLQLLAEGNTAKEVADILYISPRTVEFHKYQIMDELGVTTTAELIQYAIKHSIV
jgi:DNA-binding NarL/FixJ family response regulator